jgi:hypothetical protein
MGEKGSPAEKMGGDRGCQDQKQQGKACADR